jgi:proteic killer suppression protein
MVIRSFKDKEGEAFFLKAERPRRKGWDHARGIVKRKLDMLEYAKELRDLKSPPANRLEALKGNLTGFFSIRVNDQWRIVFGWDNQPFDVQIMDYH